MSRTPRRPTFQERRAAIDADAIPENDLLAVARGVLDVVAGRAGMPQFRLVNRCALLIVARCVERLLAGDWV